MTNGFLRTKRLLFCRWEAGDLLEAEALWGDPLVTRWITATGRMTVEEVADRLAQEVERDKQFGIQYWPLRELSTGELAGCCGLRLTGKGSWNWGFTSGQLFGAGAWGKRPAGPPFGTLL